MEWYRGSHLHCHEILGWSGESHLYRLEIIDQSSEIDDWGGESKDWDDGIIDWNGGILNKSKA